MAAGDCFTFLKSTEYPSYIIKAIPNFNIQEGPDRNCTPRNRILSKKEVNEYKSNSKIEFLSEKEVDAYQLNSNKLRW